MARFFEKSNFIFALIALVPTVPTIILVIYKGDYEPFDILIVLGTAAAAFITIVLLVHWLRLLIRYLQPERDKRPLSDQTDLRRGFRKRR